MKSAMRAASFLLTLLLFVFMMLPAAADTTAAETTASETAAADTEQEPVDDVKLLIITEKDGKGIIQAEPDGMMFWEYPLLPAGQLREGTLKIINRSGKDVGFSLDYIDLPYGDETTLTYLTYLYMTVTQPDGKVLYDGSYAAICGENGLKLQEISLKPNESVDYHIALHCAFTYQGNPSEETSHIAWNIKASSAAEKRMMPNGLMKWVGIAAAVVLIAVGIGLFWSRKKRHTK